MNNLSNIIDFPVQRKQNKDNQFVKQSHKQDNLVKFVFYSLFL